MKVKSTYVPQQLAYESSNPYVTAELQKFATKHGGFDPATKTAKPMTLPDTDSREESAATHLVLDSIAASVEASTIDQESWSQQLFADESSLDVFLRDLAEYEDCYRIKDRWYGALFALAGGVDEEGLVTGAELADKLSEAATF